MSLTSSLGQDITGYLVMVKGMTGVYHENGKYAITKEVGEMDFKYDSVDYYGYTNEDYYFFASYKGKWGIVDSENREIVPFEYEFVTKTPYNNPKNIFVAQKKGRLGTVNLNNQVVIPLQYDAITGDWCEWGPHGHFASKEGKFGLISPNGVVVVPVEFDGLAWYFNKYVLVRKGNKYGVMNLKSEFIVPLEYDLIYVDYNFWATTDQNKFMAKKNGDWKYFNEEGKIITHPEGENEVITDFSWVPADKLEGSPCLIWAK